MKKILFATFCFTLLGMATVQAQKPKSNAQTEESPANGGSTARTAKVGKGSPIIQRTAGGTTTTPATEAKTEEAAPASVAPAPVSEKPKTETAEPATPSAKGEKPKAEAPAQTKTVKSSQLASPPAPAGESKE